MRRKRSAAIFGEDGTAGEQSAQSEQEETRLAQGNVPENARGFVTRVLAERAARRVVHEIDQAAVVRLLELMNRLANEQVQIEFAAQRTQLAAFPAIHDRFRDSDRAAKSGDDSAHRRNFHLPGGIAHQEHASRTNAPLDRSPPVVHRDSRALVTKRREPALLHEALEAAAGFLAVLADQTQNCALA